MWGIDKFTYGLFLEVLKFTWNYRKLVKQAMMILVLFLLLPHIPCKPQTITCRIQATVPIGHKYFQAGDLIIGGITSFIFISRVIEHFEEVPKNSAVGEPL